MSDSGFSVDKLRFDKTDPDCSVALSKVIFLLICKIKTNFIATSQLLCMGWPLTGVGGECKQKKNLIFIDIT